MQDIFGVVVHEFHFDPSGFLDDVVIGEDIAIPVNDHAGAEALAWLIFRLAELELASTATPTAEEALEKVLQATLMPCIVIVRRLLRCWRRRGVARDSVLSLSSGCSRWKY